MDPEEQAKQAVANLLKQRGIVKDNLGQDNALAKRFRDQILSSLNDLEGFSSMLDERLLTIHAWNPQMAAMFYAGDDNDDTYSGNLMVVTYKMSPDAAFQLAGIQPTDADPYDLEGFFPQAEAMNATIQEPKLFVYVDKQGNDTAAV